VPRTPSSEIAKIKGNEKSKEWMSYENDKACLLLAVL